MVSTGPARTGSTTSKHGLFLTPLWYRENEHSGYLMQNMTCGPLSFSFYSCHWNERSRLAFLSLPLPLFCSICTLIIRTPIGTFTPHFTSSSHHICTNDYPIKPIAIESLCIFPFNHASNYVSPFFFYRFAVLLVIVVHVHFKLSFLGSLSCFIVVGYCVTLRVFWLFAVLYIMEYQSIVFAFPCFT